MSDSVTKSRAALLTCLLLALMTLGVYWPVIHCEFINFDDTDYVTKNLHVRTGLSWDNVRWAATVRYAGNWHPLTWISHMLDCQLYGLNPAGHHVTNLLLHTANSILIFLILRRMTGAQWRSAFVAALFALHPLHVESVAWVAERKDVLSTFFWALTIWAYVRYAQTTDDRGQKTEDRGQTSDLRPPTSDLRPPTSDLRPPTSDLRPPTSDLRPLTSGSYWLVMLFFALGLLAKPMLVTLPFLLLLLDFWPLRRMPTTLRVFGHEIRMADESGEPAATRAPLRRLVMEKLPLFVLAGLSCAATLWAQGYAVGILGIPFHIRLENALLSYLRYIEKMLWPTKLVVLYPFSEDFTTWHLVAAIIAVASLIYLAIRYARACPYLFTGWFWYVAVLVPVIGLVQVGLQSMADRYTYVPSIGLFIIIAWGGYDLARRWQLRPAAVAVLAVLPILACIPLTRAQLACWKDSVVLFENALRWTSDNLAAENDLGVTLSDRGQYEDACKHFTEAIRIFPKVPQAHFGRALALDVVRCHLALALDRLGRTKEAVEQYHEALALNPRMPAVLNNLAWILAAHADPEVRNGAEAVRLAEQACELTGFKEATMVGTLGAAYAEAGRFEQAVEMARKAEALAAAAGHTQLADKDREMAELFLARQPFHESNRAATNPAPARP
jgi:Flp pilus assembly protein TadD